MRLMYESLWSYQGNLVIKERFLGGSSGNNKKKIKNLKIGYNEKILENILLMFLRYDRG